MGSYCIMQGDQGALCERWDEMGGAREFPGEGAYTYLWLIIVDA